jgi:aminoglycoside phosphotransferase family enzyme
VFLAGPEAWKIKRAVAFPYMDFSTLEKRHRFCLRERDVNRRTAPDLYLDVVAVTRGGDGLRLGGDGATSGRRVVEWVLVMRRFDQADLLSALAGAGGLTAGMMTALAEAIARFHATAEARRDPAGGAQAMTWVVRENGEEFAERGDLFDRRDSRRLSELGGVRSRGSRDPRRHRFGARSTLLAR